MRFPNGRPRESSSQNNASKWDTFSRRHRSGKCIPESSLRMGCVFPMAPQRKARPGIRPQNGTCFPIDVRAENTSQNPPSERDTVSRRSRSGKRVPEFDRRVGHGFRLSPDWETPSHSHQKTDGPNTVRAARSVRYVERLLACYVIPDDVVAVGENVVAAGRHGRRAVDRVHPTARAAILLLGQTADRGDIRAVR